MLKAQRTASVILMMALDAAALVLAFLLVWQLRAGLGEAIILVAQHLGLHTHDWVRRIGEVPAGQYDLSKVVISSNPMVNIANHLWVLYFSLLSWLTLLHFQKGYDLGLRRTSRHEFAVCAYTGLLATISLLAFMALLHLETSRLFLVGLLIVGVAFLWAERVLVLPIALRGGRARRHILLIGPAAAARQYSAMLATPAYQWSDLVGYISEETVSKGDVKHLGTLNELPAILDNLVIDEVILVRVATESARGVNWGDILQLCLERGRTVSVVEDIHPPVNAKVEAGMMGRVPVLVLHNTPQNPLALGIKSALDRVVAAVMLVLLSGLFAVIAILIKLEDGGPVFFVQDRVGLNGRHFRFFKFRSMRVNAQEVLERMRVEEPEKYRAINIMEEPFFKAAESEDPRITRIGRFLRKSSLDEFPQFWNVLKGDMSLVGPRPPLPKEVAQLAPWQRRKLSVKGGLTCIWQASGRNEITGVDEWMQMDLDYIDNWSLWLDVKLLFLTVKSVFRARGAT